MTEAAKAAWAAYMRVWRKRNPEKMRQYEAARWERKAAEQRQSQPQKSAENAKNEGGETE